MELLEEHRNLTARVRHHVVQVRRYHADGVQLHAVFLAAVPQQIERRPFHHAALVRRQHEVPPRRPTRHEVRRARQRALAADAHGRGHCEPRAAGQPVFFPRDSGAASQRRRVDRPPPAADPPPPRIRNPTCDGSPRWLRGRRMPTARDHCEPRAAGPAAIFLHHPAAPSQRRGGVDRPPPAANPPPSRIRNPTCDGSRR